MSNITFTFLGLTIYFVALSDDPQGKGFITSDVHFLNRALNKINFVALRSSV